MYVYVTYGGKKVEIRNYLIAGSRGKIFFIFRDLFLTGSQSDGFNAEKYETERNFCFGRVVAQVGDLRC